MKNSKFKLAQIEIYRHDKTGDYYRFLNYALMESDKEEVVVYQNVETQSIWVRPFTEFKAKFSPVLNYE